MPSGHNRDNYIVERLNCPSHDGRDIPITIIYHKETKLDGSAHLLIIWLWKLWKFYVTKLFNSKIFFN